jgi:hypothetical protein
MSSNVLNTRHDADMLRQKLHEQQFRCWYTGQLLVPGVNASVDHTVPMARGGSHEPHNLRWVHLKVNEMKRELSESEFVAMCAAVVAYAKRESTD